MLKKIITLQLLLIAFSVTLFAQRENISLDGQWNFSIDSVKEGISGEWFKNGLPAAKEMVTVPHTWNVKKETARYWGWAWYQRNMEVPKSWRGKTIRLQFNAVYHDASVWVNGVKIGEHKGAGFTKFFIDATKYIKAGERNSITVLADNSFSTTNIPYSNSFDWPNDGGIIRSVSMLATNPVYIQQVQVNAKPDFTNAAKPQGMTAIKIIIPGLEKLDKKKLACNITVTEENQPTANTIYNATPAVKFQENNLLCQLNFDSIHLWHFDNPNLYKINVTLRYKNKITDTFSVNTGFREFKVVGDAFVFNGEKIRIAGAEIMFGSSLKNGMAETKEELEAYLKKAAYLNVMFTRFHWQQDDFVHDWCDRHGVLTQEEIPIWGNKVFMTDTMLRIAKGQLTEMIGDHYNHPSIISWGVGNEINARDAKNIKGVKELYQFAKSTDPSRLSSYVSNTLQQARSWMPAGTLPDASAEGDMLMFNDYHTTWYRQSHGTNGAVLDTIQAENKKMPLVISEFGLCEPENWGDDSRRLKDMIYSYALYESKPYIAGAIYFCVNDYRTHMGGGNYGIYSTRVHGVYDLEGNPKPSAEVLREMNCPVEVSGLNRNKENKIAITVVAATGLPEYTLTGYKVYWSKDVANFKTQGEMIALPTVTPGKLTDLLFKNAYNDKGVLTIENGRGKMVYQKVIPSTFVY